MAAPAGPIARLASLAAEKMTCGNARSILYFSKDLPCRCGLGNWPQRGGRRKVPEKGVLNNFNSEPIDGRQDYSKADFSVSSVSPFRIADYTVA